MRPVLRPSHDFNALQARYLVCIFSRIHAVFALGAHVETKRRRQRATEG